MRRRRFLWLCSGWLAFPSLEDRPPHILPPAGPLPEEGLKRFTQAKIVGPDGAPLKAADLKEGVAYVFHYPYVSTPCLLIDVGIPLPTRLAMRTMGGRPYVWPGGVGPKRSIVAYSGICSHLMSHPNRLNSFVNYYHRVSRLANRGKVISCCAHGSVFDAAAGGAPIRGQTPQPLLTIALEHNERTDVIKAVGLYGESLILRQFFNLFRRDLRRRYGRGEAIKEVPGVTEAIPMQAFTSQRVSC